MLILCAANTTIDVCCPVRSLPSAALILAGGVGSRVPCVSSEACPKQFIKFSSGLSTFQLAVANAMRFVERASFIYVVTNKMLAHLARRQLCELGLYGANDQPTVILEERRNNTCAAVAIGLRAIRSRLGDAVVCMMPSDAVIDGCVLGLYVRCAMAFACAWGCVVLFGVEPKYASSDFGYIVLGPCSGSLGVFKVERFVEKPAGSVAASFLREHNCLWNSGMAVFRSSDMLARIDAFMGVQGVMLSVPIDVAIFNSANDLFVVPMPGIDWVDIGSPKNFCLAMAAT